MKKLLTFLPVLSIFILLCGVFPRGEVRGSDGIVGAEICKGCHEDHYNSFAKSIHGNKQIANSPVNRDACESCHGPGGAHVEKSGEKGVGILIFSKKFADAREKSNRCLSCHGDSRDLSFWDLAKHRTVGVSCDNCHTVHSMTRRNLKAPQPELCNICHRAIRSQENKQSHHPIREGRMKCTDCHDHHGSFGPKMLKAESINELCYRCHAEKRGPFMWEHPPVQENCATCHTPHGSNHNKLLNSRVPQLCQSCHDAAQHPGTPYTSFNTFQGSATSGKNRMFAQACLNCHSTIHGSNGPSTRGERHVR